jgi:hypothetical protein
LLLLHAGLFSRGSHALVCILGYTMLLQTVAVYSGPHWSKPLSLHQFQSQTTQLKLSYRLVAFAHRATASVMFGRLWTICAALAFHNPILPVILCTKKMAHRANTVKPFVVWRLRWIAYFVNIKNARKSPLPDVAAPGDLLCLVKDMRLMAAAARRWLVVA